MFHGDHLKDEGHVKESESDTATFAADTGHDDTVSGMTQWTRTQVRN